jgi:hypothetical protein
VVGTIPANVPDWAFYGPFATVTVTNSQKIYASGIAVLRSDSGSPAIDVDVCLANVGVDPNFLLPLNFVHSPLGVVVPTAEPRVVPVAGFAAPGVNGTFRIGFCARNTNMMAIINNQSTKGFVFVLN